MNDRMRQFLFAVLAIVLAASATASSAGDRIARPVIDLHGGNFHIEPAAGKAGMLFDPSQGLTVEAVRARLDEFRTVETDHIDFGAFGDVEHMIWLHFRVRNRSARADSWIISLNRSHLRYATIHLLAEGEPAQSLLSSTARAAVYSPTDGPFIAAPFSLGAGEVADILVAYRNEHSLALPVTFATAEGYRASLNQRNLINYSANGAWIAVIVIMLILGGAIGWRLSLSFAFYQLNALLVIMSAELYILRSPGISADLIYRTDMAFYLFMVLGMMLFAQQFFETSRNFPIVERILRIWYLLFGLVAPFSIALHPHPVFSPLATLLVAPSAIFYFVIAILAMRRGLIGATLMVIGSGLVLIAGAVDVTEKLNPGLIHHATSLEIGHMAFIAEGLLFAGAIVYRLLVLRKERDHSLRAEVASAHEKLRLSQALAESQRRFNAARRKAEQRRTEIASVSHDLQQPLASLRKGLAGIKRLDRGSAAEMNLAFDYLERLAATGMEESLPDQEESGAEGREETFPISAVLDNVVAMFRHEAGAKGLSLRYCPSTASVRAEPMAIMRIASNLTANAIKHGHKGGVLIGCRMGRDHIALEVHDTGPGMTAGQLSEVMHAYRKGEESDGHGLGLHLVRTVCLQHKLPFTARSVPQRGSSFRIEIPRA